MQDDVLETAMAFSGRAAGVSGRPDALGPGPGDGERAPLGWRFFAALGPLDAALRAGPWRWGAPRAPIVELARTLDRDAPAELRMVATTSARESERAHDEARDSGAALLVVGPAAMRRYEAPTVAHLPTNATSIDAARAVERIIRHRVFLQLATIAQHRRATAEAALLALCHGRPPHLRDAPPVVVPRAELVVDVHLRRLLGFGFVTRRPPIAKSLGISHHALAAELARVPPSRAEATTLLHRPPTVTIGFEGHGPHQFGARQELQAIATRYGVTIAPRRRPGGSPQLVGIEGSRGVAAALLAAVREVAGRAIAVVRVPGDASEEVGRVLLQAGAHAIWRAGRPAPVEAVLAAGWWAACENAAALGRLVAPELLPMLPGVGDPRVSRAELRRAMVQEAIAVCPSRAAAQAALGIGERAMRSWLRGAHSARLIGSTDTT